MQLDERELQNLLVGARAGRRESLAMLCAAFYPAILKYMRYRVDPTSAEDLTGEVFLRVLRNIARQNGSFVAWLYKIASNVVADHLRAGVTRRERSLDEQTVEPVQLTVESSQVSDRKMDLEAAMNRLTDDQRELLTLKFIQGLSNSDVAEITGRSPEAVRGLQFRALKALREVMDRGDGGRNYA